jgi:uncharacterized protein YbcI
MTVAPSTSDLQDIKQTLSEQLKQLYKRELDRQLSNISCYISQGILVIFMEGTVTQSEQILAASENQSLAQKVRMTLDRAMKPQIETIVENITNMKIIDFLSKTTIEYNWTGAIVIFELEPKATESANLTSG